MSKRTRSQRPSKARSRASEAPQPAHARVADAPDSQAAPARVSMLPPESDELAALDAGWDDVLRDAT